MKTVFWVFVLCLQGFLLTHALDCKERDMDCESVQVEIAKLRSLRDTISDHGRGGHQSQVKLPGAFTAKGFPKTIIQSDRSRRHLNINKKRPLPPKSRVGSYSLLSHHSMSPLPVERAQKHVGATADPAMPSGMRMKQRSRRNARRNKTTKAAEYS